MDLERSAHLISEYAGALHAGGAAASAAALGTFAAFVAETASQPLGDLGQRIRRAQQAAPTAASGVAGAASAGEVAGQLDLLGGLLASAGAKKDVSRDLITLAGWLRGFGESPCLAATLDLLRDAMRPIPPEVCTADYIARLLQEAGSPAFDVTHAELASSDLAREQVVAIACAVYGRIAKSTSRPKALAFIRKPHDARVSTRRGNEAMRGRSAA